MRFTLPAFFLAFALQLAPQAKSSIEGTVLNAATHDPVSGAQVSLVKVSGPTGAQIQADPLSPAVLSDRDGKFAMAELSPGTYRLYAARNRFARAEYGQRSLDGIGSVVTLATGQSMKDVVFKLTPAAAVTGRVTDTSGEPLTSVIVELLRVAYDSTGKRTFRPVFAARTNDLGDYRLYWVTPGRYYLAVTAGKTAVDDVLVESSNEAFRLAHQPGPMPVDARETFQIAAFYNTNEVLSRAGYVPTYYPGTADPSAATPLDVGPASDVGGINFRVVRQQPARIRGRVIEVSGQPAAAASVILLAADGSVAGNAQARNGAFEIRDVAPGSYLLRAIPRSAAAAASAAAIENATSAADAAAVGAAIAAALSNGGGAPTSEARMRIDVSGADLDNIVLNARAGITIQGRVQIEGLGRVSDLMNWERMNVVLAAANSTTTQPSRPARFKADGTFVVENVFPGQYRIRVDGRPTNVFMKDVRVGGVDLMRQTLDIEDSDAGVLNLVMNSNAGQIEGTLVDKNAKPAGGLTVVLIPNDLRMRREIYRTATTDTAGRFALNAVTPGEYKVFSWEELEPFSYYDPEVMKRFEERGSPVTIREAMKSLVQVSLIPTAL